MRLYKRPNSPFWFVDIEHAGRRFRRSTRETERSAAQLVAARFVAELGQQRSVTDAWRIRDCFGAYYTDVGQHRRSADQIFRQLEWLADFLGADTAITAITDAQLVRYRAHRRGATGAQLHTINRHFAALKAALNHAANVYKQAGPLINWKALHAKEPPWRTRFASQDELARILDAADADLAAIILCAAMTGLRRGNILRAEWHQLDLRSGTLTLPRTKTNVAHAVVIGSPLIERLRDTYAALTIDPDNPTVARVPSGLIFNAKNFRSRWQAARETADLRDFCFRDLRHTFASYARLANTDIFTLREAMSHSNISMTMRYAHILPAERDTTFSGVARQMPTTVAHSVAHKPKKRRV